jgi:eukaryotic-like serine/threonine-protein kinase
MSASGLLYHARPPAFMARALSVSPPAAGSASGFTHATRLTATCVLPSPLSGPMSFLGTTIEEQDETTLLGQDLPASKVAWAVIGDRLAGGRYTIKSLLGDGGMGRVWLAEDLVEKREVALKELFTLSGPRANLQLAEFFKREFFAMKKLEHPGTVKVFDFGMLENGHRYLTMEVIPGVELSSVKGPQPKPVVVDTLFQLAQILAFIHGRFFVHCDIKASNVRRLPSGQIKLMDFGVMHQLGTQITGSMVGTPAYMAPEWLTGGVIDGRTDLYSVGVLAYRLLTGQLPFPGKDVRARLRGQAAPPSSITPVDPKLEAIVLRLLDREPHRRFSSATELLAAVAEAGNRALPEESVAVRSSYLLVRDVIGRERELKQLVELLETPKDKAARRAVFIGAPAGVGKSRLLKELELAAYARDIVFVSGRCRAEGTAPLAPLRQVVRGLWGATPNKIADRHRARLNVLLPAEEALAQTRPVPKSQVFDALTAWLRDLADEDAAPVIALEDLHWADSATLEFMNVIVRALQGTRGLLVGTYRSNELDRTSMALRTVIEGSADILELQQLTREHVVGLLEEVLVGFEVPAAFADHLYAAGGGNAFFTMECLRALIEKDALRLVGGRWQASQTLAGLKLPGSISAVVQERLAAVPEPLAACLRKLSCAGRSVDVRLAARYVGLSEEPLFAMLDDAVDRQFLTYEQGQYFFLHDTVVSAAYESTPADLRKRVHAQIAEAAVTLWGDAPELQRAIGYHWARSDDPRRAVEPLLRAGDHARRTQAIVEAASCYGAAIELLDTLPDFADREAALAKALVKATEIAFFGNAAKVIAWGERLFAWWDTKSGLMQQGRAEVEAMLAKAASQTGEERKATLKALYHCDVDQLATPRVAFVKRAELLVPVGIQIAGFGRRDLVPALRRRIEQEQPAGLIYSQLARGWRQPFGNHYSEFGGLTDELYDAYDRADAAFAELTEVPLLMGWGRHLLRAMPDFVLAGMGAPIDVARVKQELDGIEATGFPDIAIFLCTTLIKRAAFTGNGPAFDEALLALRSWAKRLGNPGLAERWICIWTPHYHLERGDAEAAVALVDKAAAVLKMMPGDATMPRYAAVFRACAAVLRGEADAEAHFAHARKALEGLTAFRHDVLLRTYECRLELARGRTDAAKAAAAWALERAMDPQYANPFDEILARRAAAEVAGDDEALQQLALAAALAAKTQNVLQHAHTELAWGERLKRLGREGATAHLEKAAALYESAQAPALVQRARSLLTTGA